MILKNNNKEEKLIRFHYQENFHLKSKKENSMKTTKVYLENNLPKNAILLSSSPRAFDINKHKKKHSPNFPGIIFHLFKQLVENIF